MTKKVREPEIVEETPAEDSPAADWKDAFEHAVKAAREAFNAAAEATAEMLRQGGKLAEQTVGEAQRTIVVTLDEEMIETLDKMVSAGVHKSRTDAIRYLLRQGIKTSGDLLARINQVETQIEDLRAKMRDIPLENANA